jgi:hypothetical protein
MTVHLEWPPDVVQRLTEEARQRGLTLDDYVLQTVLEQQGSNGPPAHESENRSKREEAAANIRHLRKGNILGPDLSIRDLVEEGRRF